MLCFSDFPQISLSKGCNDCIKNKAEYHKLFRHSHGQICSNACIVHLVIACSLNDISASKKK